MTPFKKNNKSTVYYNDFFLQIIFYNTGLYSHIDKYTRLCLGTFEYIEAEREIYKKNGLQNPKNIPQHFMCEFLTILHIVSLSVGLTFTLALVAQPFAVLFTHKVIALTTDEFGFLVL